MGLLFSTRFPIIMTVFCFIFWSDLQGVMSDDVQGNGAIQSNSQWSGGCYKDCGLLHDAFCEPEPFPMCMDCSIYCLKGEDYYSVPDCQSKCPFYFIITTTTTSTYSSTHSPNISGGWDIKYIVAVVLVGIALIALFISILCIRYRKRFFSRKANAVPHQPQQEDSPSAPDEKLLP